MSPASSNNSIELRNSANFSVNQNTNTILRSGDIEGSYKKKSPFQFKPQIEVVKPLTIPARRYIPFLESQQEAQIMNESFNKILEL